MKKAIGLVIIILISFFYFVIYWSTFYIGIDKLTFELSTSNIKFASAQVVYDMFLINIVVSLILAQTVVIVNALLFTRRRKSFYKINLAHLPFLLVFLYIINRSETVIPFIKNWHVSLL
jgi:hypothetical protein